MNTALWLTRNGLASSTLVFAGSSLLLSVQADTAVPVEDLGAVCGREPRRRCGLGANRLRNGPEVSLMLWLTDATSMLAPMLKVTDA
jgi:hypothetical protein